MSVHVLLGYYDPYSISHRHDKSTLVPTLFQNTGLATNQNGYMKVSKKPMREIVFGSGAPGSPSDSYLLNMIETDSDNISILHISDPIIPPGIDSVKETPAPVTTPSTASSPTKQTTPAPTASPPTKQATPAPLAMPPTASSPTKQVTPAPLATPPTASSPTKQVTPAPVATPPPTASSPMKQVSPTPDLAPTEKAAATAPANAPKMAPIPTAAPQTSASAPSSENVSEAPTTSTDEAGEAPTPPSSAGRVAVGATIGLAMGVILLGAC
ncbi:putative fasciclin-like arabinogalactan protein 3 [Cocos nucifera]|uniref:Putative fasciclin-like arabinogalactan protein 3 n=1 Tax=Cocos nucifera TaxID=13894 RepID=A0A8K0HU70_COCNU|nr:putative fasciclin-like arabinogalactan protein 3 [Cocos nucifera]